MRLDRQIAIVKSMLARAESGEEIARLTSLLLILQNEYIALLEKKNLRKVA